MARKKTKKLSSRQALFLLLLCLVGSALYRAFAPAPPVVALEDLPPYDGQPYAVVEGNQPAFAQEELTADSYETYGSLDALGRCTTAIASIGPDLMPTEDRGSIGSVHPTGWEQNFYDWVDGKALYNRCHLIGFQLTGENANDRNLITGTRYLNVDGMLPFENLVADYIHETGNHVLYRVTPVFQGTELVARGVQMGTELVARGVQMEALSVEDGGEGVCFNVFCYNVQPGVEIDYATGENWAEGAA